MHKNFAKFLYLCHGLESLSCNPHYYFFSQLHEIYSKVCKKRQMGAVDHSEFQGITTLLESRGMIGIKKAKETRLAKVS